MLRGRESLVRLIGKRRRILPTRRSYLLSAAPAKGLLTVCDGATDEGFTELPMKRCRQKMALEEDCMEGRLRIDEEEEAFVEEKPKKSISVNCPVCGIRISGEDYTINTHLDVCLTRGAKRKLKQFTLLQFNFTKDNVYNNDEIDASTYVVHTNTNNALQQDIHHEAIKSSTSQDTDTNPDALCQTYERAFDRIEQSNGGCEGKLSVNSESVKNGHGDGFTEESDVGNEILVEATQDSVLSEMDLNIERTMSEVFKTVLQTHIVGRRFVDEVDIKSGAKIFLLRDPDNPKDPNAIKIVDADTDYHSVLGFLPRALAQYLSPLIDKYQIIFEGVIASVPKHSLDVVPITLTCQKKSFEADIEHDDFRLFKSLWENVLHLADDGKNCPPNWAKKYQKNFCLMIQEVIKSNPHLYVEDEICFFDLFNSLSENSQKLFIRLYMRKGPWFRLSNISYPEILDTQQAVMGLIETGYVRSFACQHEVDDEELKEVLNVMTVTELNEIRSMFEESQRRLGVNI